MQGQMDKITELIQLVVQKMEIRTEVVFNDRSKCDDNEECMPDSKLRQTINVTRRLQRLRASMKNTAFNNVRNSDV